MSLLALTDSDLELGTERGALVVRRRGVTIRTVPLHEVDEVHLYGGADVTVGARNLLLLRGVDTVFLTLDGRVRGRLVGWETRQAERRIAQYRLVIDPPRALALARVFVLGKLANQRALVQSRQRHLRLETLASLLGYLRGAETRSTAARNADELRGVEGAAADRYFATFGALLTNTAFAWSGRNRRPPRDPVNACLSFGYTLLSTRAEHALRAAGLDVSLGVLHGLSRGSPALALDFVESFRPLVDNLVLTLLNRRQLGPEDFGPPEPGNDLTDEGAYVDGAIYLGPVGRKIFLQAWARRLQERSPHPVLEGDWSVAGLLVSQAQQLRSFVEGETEAFVPAELT